MKDRLSRVGVLAVVFVSLFVLFSVVLYLYQVVLPNFLFEEWSQRVEDLEVR